MDDRVAQLKAALAKKQLVVEEDELHALAGQGHIMPNSALNVQVPAVTASGRQRQRQRQ